MVQEDDETGLFSNGDLIARFCHRKPQNSLGKIKKITFIAQFANLNIIVPHAFTIFQILLSGQVRKVSGPIPPPPVRLSNITALLPPPPQTTHPELIKNQPETVRNAPIHKNPTWKRAGKWSGRYWKAAQAGTRSLNFSLTMTTRDMTMARLGSAVPSKLGQRKFSRYCENSSIMIRFTENPEP
jgi:hypothetical protein